MSLSIVPIRCIIMQRQLHKWILSHVIAFMGCNNRMLSRTTIHNSSSIVNATLWIESVGDNDSKSMWLSANECSSRWVFDFWITSMDDIEGRESLRRSHTLLWNQNVAIQLVRHSLEELNIFVQDFNVLIDESRNINEQHTIPMYLFTEYS